MDNRGAVYLEAATEAEVFPKAEVFPAITRADQARNFEVMDVKITHLYTHL